MPWIIASRSVLAVSSEQRAYAKKINITSLMYTFREFFLGFYFYYIYFSKHLH